MSLRFEGRFGFDQTIRLAPGGAAGVDGGPITVAVVWRPEGTRFGGIIQGRAAGSAVWSLVYESDGKYYFSNDFTGSLTYPVGVWHLIVITKPDGLSTYRAHLHRYDTNTWTSGDFAAVGDGSGPIDEIYLGRANGRMDGDLAAAGIWTDELSETTVETLSSGLAPWVASGAVAAWHGQELPVLDRVGNAHQIEIIGEPPTLLAEEPPGFSFDLDPPPPTSSRLVRAGGVWVPTARKRRVDGAWVSL